MDKIYNKEVKFRKDGFEDLKAFQKAFQLAMDVFEISKIFPKEEKYSLTDQIRRSSRSVCANIAEGYRKEYTPSPFVPKLLMLMANAQKQSFTLNLQSMLNTYQKKY